MSCFVVSDYHVSALAAAARALVHTLQGMAVHPSHYADLVAALAAADLAAELAELAEPVPPSCPHCARDLEAPAELAAGLCTSDDCPRHDAPELADMGAA